MSHWQGLEQTFIGVRDFPARDISSLGALGPGGEQNPALFGFRRVLMWEALGGKTLIY